LDAFETRCSSAYLRAIEFIISTRHVFQRFYVFYFCHIFVFNVLNYYLNAFTFMNKTKCKGSTADMVVCR